MLVATGIVSPMQLETATTAIQAGFSGHFVVSTLHTNDAPSTVVRLRDMGIDAFKVASVLKGIVAQRLQRRLDGLGVLEELRAQMRSATLPVIMLTAQHGESEEKALDLGAQDYMTKPVQTRSLAARVRAVLRRINT